ncbi:MAG: apolipoprotein N-acyltransferase, partial [Desulfobacca sp.]|nr:apolipoprotein N-acyltransferase [Desulfobacca sp.]
TAIPFYFKKENQLTPRLFQLTRETGSHLLFGSPAAEVRDGKTHYFNRAYLLSPEGQVSFYDKIHLVPFGEYVPLRKLLPFVGKMVEAIGDFSPGSGNQGLTHPKGKLGVLICFETIFPELSRSYKKEGAQFLVNMTNDAWFGKTSAPYQHLSILTFRAIENRVWVARAANTGFSAFIDSTGQIIKSFPLFQSGGIYANIPLRSEKTFYSRHGDLLVVFCCLVFLGGIAMADRNEKRGKRS